MKGRRQSQRRRKGACGGFRARISPLSLRRCESNEREQTGVRWVLVVAVLILAILAGLYIYGDMLQTDTRMIEQEALRGSGG